MKKHELLASGLAVVTMIATVAIAAAPEEVGKRLHTESCVGCHASRFDGNAAAIYTRNDRKVGDYAKLHAQVAFCNQQVGTQWFDEDVTAVTDYLNREYYHFTKP